MCNGQNINTSLMGEVGHIRNLHHLKQLVLFLIFFESRYLIKEQKEEERKD
jgi:hypothetical protein